jgi:TPR repeat protein
MAAVNIQSKLVLLGMLAFCATLVSCEDYRADKAYTHGDYKKAVEELKDLAEHGEARAQYDLALLYDKGQGVPQNDKEAFYWYRKAAEQEDDRAQHNLGLMYANGQGVEQNYMEAYYWINLAAAQGNKHALDARDYLSDKMTAEQIVAAKKLAHEREERKKAQTCTFCELFHRGSPP